MICRTLTCFLAALCIPAVGARTVSALLARGYTVLPDPQQVTLGAGDFRFDNGWALETVGIESPDPALESLRQDLASRCGIALGEQRAGKSLRLALSPGAVEIGTAQDPDRAVLAAQAYRMELSSYGISITANAPAGLFYGVQTFLQLLHRRADGAFWLPEARIVDWPDLQLRQIYWDDAHHLDRLDELKRAVRQAAFYKINGFALKLEGHFQYGSAPALVEPNALTSAELQELTDYALHYYVQLIPYLDAPAHIAFILKHPEYAALRAFPDSNYEACATNPGTYKLYFSLFDDLLAANRGVKYFYLSTDEPYYVGLADNQQCQEADAARRLGGVGKLLAEFVTRTADYLHDRGRTVIFWGEYPMKPADIGALPSHLVNGEVYGPQFDPVFRKHGIREMIYTSTEGEEKLFPDYFLLSPDLRLHPERNQAARVAQAIAKISFDSARRDADLMGMLVAGWADMGLHPETFWLGYATIAAAGWHPGADPRESMAAFYPLFYGSGATRMDRVYQLLSEQAQFWSDSWETASSTARKPIWGNSNSIYKPPRPARDQTLPLPPLPSDDLAYNSSWRQENARRLELAARMRPSAEELSGLLHENLARVEFNRYNLEVFLAVAALCRHNLDLLDGLGRIDSLLTSARQKQSAAPLDQALEIARKIRGDRDQVLRDATGTWYKAWLPRVEQANSRRFLHELDDVKDHLPDRTVDMSYLVWRELLLPLDQWIDKLQAIRDRHKPVRSGT